MVFYYTETGYEGYTETYIIGATSSVSSTCGLNSQYSVDVRFQYFDTVVLHPQENKYTGRVSDNVAYPAHIH